MFSIEKSCNAIANYICNELNLEDERKAVISYGLFALLQTIYSFILVLVIGAIFNVAKEALIITICITVLRKASGGTHASTPMSCLIIGTIISILPAIIIKNSAYNIKATFIIIAITFSIAYIIVFKNAPVDSINKPIKTEEKRKRLKKASLNILNYYLVSTIIFIVVFFKSGNLNMLAYASCIGIGMSWQVFSLTSTGKIFFYVMDKIINTILGGKQ